MTETEAENGAVDRHELRKLTRYTANPGIYADCWCSWQSAKYMTESSARASHRRHQDSERSRRATGI